MALRCGTAVAWGEAVFLSAHHAHCVPPALVLSPSHKAMHCKSKTREKSHVSLKRGQGWEKVNQPPARGMAQ